MLDNFKNKQVIYLINLKATDDAQDHAEDLGEIAEDAEKISILTLKILRRAKETVSAGVDEAKETTKDVPEKLQKQKKMLKMRRKT